MDIVKCVSFYNPSNTPKIVPDYQKKVCNKFSVPFEQVIVDVNHPQAIDDYLDKVTFDYLILLDIDAVPLKKSFLEDIVSRIKTGNTLFGIAQSSNHIEPVNHVYAGPSCLGLSRKLYESLGRPSFKETSRGDVAEELTWLVEENGFKLDLIWPSHVIKPEWTLGDSHIFGFGTTYADLVFHAYEIVKKPRRGVPIFIQQCEKILNS